MFMPLGLKLTAKILAKIENWIDAAPLTFTLVLIAIVIFFIGTVVLTISQGWANLLKVLNVTPSVTIVDTPTLVSDIKPLGQFVSVSYQLASADTRVDIRNGILGNENACNEWAQYAFVVEIQAGTDLSKLKPSDVTYDQATQTYTILLPTPNLTSCNVNPQYSRYAYFVTPTTACTSYERNFLDLGKYQVINAMRLRAINNEKILEDAAKENEQTLTGFFKAVTGRKVIIHYKDGDPENDSSCNPMPPTGFKQESETNGTLYWRPDR